ncbi:unnamed protein product [Closterium sp. NIES-54]
MPPRKQRDRGKGKAKVDDDEPWEEPPYVKWMKEQCENGNTRGKIRRETAPRRHGASSSSARDAHTDSSDGGGDIDVSDDDLEEIVSSSGSEDDSDNSIAKDSSDEEETDADPAASEAGPRNKPKRKKPWFEYVYLIKKLPANVKPHVLDGGGAGETHADPGAPIRDDADIGEGGMPSTWLPRCEAPPPQPQNVAPPPHANAHALTVTPGEEDSPALGGEAGDVPQDADDEARDDRKSD